MTTKHHAKRFRNLHMRYTLIIINSVVLCGLLTYGLTLRTVQAAEDAGALHAMMDSDSAPMMLMPPEVK